jgi:hypothetical protein
MTPPSGSTPGSSDHEAYHIPDGMMQRERVGSAHDDPAHRATQNGSLDAPDGWDHRLDRRRLAALFLVVWAVYLATATYDMFQVNDNRAVATSAWSLGARGTLALPGEWEGSVPWETPGVDGNIYTDRFPGIIFAAVPAYVVADRLGLVPEPAHPVLLNFVPAGLTAATIAALAVAALYVLFRQLASRRTATMAALLFAFGTASWSVSADSMWTHGLTSLALVLGMLAMERSRHLRAGTAFAVSILARPQTAVVPAVVGLWRGASRRDFRPVIAVALTSLLGLAGVSLYSRALFGTWLPVAGYDPVKVEAIATPSWRDFLERWGFTLFHPHRSVLFFTPVLLVLLPFLHRGWRIAPEWVRSSAIAGLLYLVVQLRSNVWHGGAHYFGSRLTIETLVLTAPLLLCTWQAVIRHDRIIRTGFAVLAALSIVLHAAGATVLSVTPEGREEFKAGELREVCETETPPDRCPAL